MMVVNYSITLLENPYLAIHIGAKGDWVPSLKASGS